MAWVALATAVFEFLKAIPFVIRYMDKNLGPDWYKKQDEVKKANEMLKNAKTPEEEDAALQYVARSFYK